MNTRRTFRSCIPHRTTKTPKTCQRMPIQKTTCNECSTIFDVVPHILIQPLVTKSSAFVIPSPKQHQYDRHHQSAKNLHCAEFFQDQFFLSFFPDVLFTTVRQYLKMLFGLLVVDHSPYWELDSESLGTNGNIRLPSFDASFNCTG